MNETTLEPSDNFDTLRDRLTAVMADIVAIGRRSKTPVAAE
jgi:hypothetical protein